MIGGAAKHENGSIDLLIILEPGNIALLQAGRPIHRPLSDFLPTLGGTVSIAFTPDVPFVQREVEKGVPLMEAVEKSLTRKEVFERPKHAIKHYPNVEIGEIPNAH